MHKFPKFAETEKYETRQLTKLKMIYQNANQEYTSSKYITKKKEYFFPQTLTTLLRERQSYGIIPQIKVFWISNNRNLFIWKYEINVLDEIPDFQSNVLFVEAFVPQKNVFKENIHLCLLIVTEEQAIIYGLLADTNEIVNTNLVVSLPEEPTCVKCSTSGIFLGCKDGNLYQIIYKPMSLLTFKNIEIYSPDLNTFSYLIPTFFKHKERNPIKSLSIGTYHLVTLTNEEIRIFKFKNQKVYKFKEISTQRRDYLSIQIVEEEQNSLLFCVFCRDGSRDFFDYSFLFSRKSPQSDDREICDTTFDSSNNLSCCVKKTSNYEGCVATVVSLNYDQVLNYERNRAAENSEILIFNENMNFLRILENEIFFISNFKILLYEKSGIEKYLASCRPEDVYKILKSYGERETLIFYIHTLGKDEEVSKIEYLYSKNENYQNEALYSYIYRTILPVLKKNISVLLKDDISLIEMINRKLLNVFNKLKKYRKTEALEFLENCIQTLNFLKIIYEYGESSEFEVTFEETVLSDTEFKKSSLNLLIKNLNNRNTSIEPLIRDITRLCPTFFPLEEIYYQRGMQLLNKAKFSESLENFKKIKNFNLENVIFKFNEATFYAGSAALLRNCSYGDMHSIIGILEASLQCEGALNVCLEDPREEFNFYVFEALLVLLKNGNNNFFYKNCLCCGSDLSDRPKSTINDILKVQSPFLKSFLKEKSLNSLNKEEFELLWKFYLFHKDRIQATNTLVELAENKPLTLSERNEYLLTALSVSIGTELNTLLKQKVELSKIQSDMLSRTSVVPSRARNMLLSANELFNDYTLPLRYSDLSLRIIDMSTYSDKKTIKTLWEQTLSADYAWSTAYLQKFRVKGECLDLSIIGSILVSKMPAEGDNLCAVLVEYGFSKRSVLEFVEKVLRTTDHPRRKEAVLKDLKEFCLKSGVKEDERVYERCASFCCMSYGIVK